MSIAPHGCPVCGFPEFEALDESGGTTFDICPACGCESGYEYGKEESAARLAEIRRRWLTEKKGAWWNSRVAPPAGWDPMQQLKAAGLQT